MSVIKTCSQTNIKIMNSDTQEVFAYRVFVLLKSIDDGSGRISNKVANKATTLFFNRNFTIKSLSRLPELAKYMVFTDTDVYLSSWEKIWDYFEVSPYTWTEIPLNAVKSKKDFLAYIYAGFISTRTISREKIEEITGIARSTQYKYERISDCSKSFNYLEMTEEEYLDDQYIPTDEDGKVTGVFVKDGMFYRQMPNTYYSKIKITKTRKQLAYNTRQNVGINRRKAYNVLFLDNRFVNSSGKVSLHLERKGTSFTKISGNLWIKNEFGYAF